MINSLKSASPKPSKIFVTTLLSRPDPNGAIKIFEKCYGVKIFVFNLYNYVYSCVVDLS